MEIFGHAQSSEYNTFNDLNDFYIKYYEEYKPKDIKMKDYYKWREKIIYTIVLLGASGLIVYLYNK